MKKYDWRGVFLNRRGFDTKELKNEKFLHQNELEDFLFIFEKYKEEFPDSNFYLCGMSAGSSYGARLLAEYPEKMPFKAFISICNPFNFTNTCFHMDRSIIGRKISSLITQRAKVIAKYHAKNNDLITNKLR